MKANGGMGNITVKAHYLLKVDTKYQVNGDSVHLQVVQQLGLMELNMRENSRIGIGMVMVNLVSLMDTILLENSKSKNLGKL